MNLSQKQWKIVSASMFDGDVLITKPLPKTEMKENFASWMKKQDAFWPVEITTEVLLNNIECVYLPYWVVSASA